MKFQINFISFEELLTNFGNALHVSSLLNRLHKIVVLYFSVWV